MPYALNSDSDSAVDSDQSSDSDPEDFNIIFTGLTVSQLRRGGGRAVWTDELKTIMFKHAIQHGYSSKNLPTPAQLMQLCSEIMVPMDQGLRVVRACVQKVVSWISSNVNQNTTMGLIMETCIGKFGQQLQHQIYVAEALIKGVRHPAFSFGKSIQSGQLLQQNGLSGHGYKQIKDLSGISSGSLIKNTVALLRKDVVKVPKIKQPVATPARPGLRSPDFRASTGTQQPHITHSYFAPQGSAQKPPRQASSVPYGSLPSPQTHLAAQGYPGPYASAQRTAQAFADPYVSSHTTPTALQVHSSLYSQVDSPQQFTYSPWTTFSAGAAHGETPLSPTSGLQYSSRTSVHPLQQRYHDVSHTLPQMPPTPTPVRSANQEQSVMDSLAGWNLDGFTNNLKSQSLPQGRASDGLDRKGPSSRQASREEPSTRSSVEVCSGGAALKQEPQHSPPGPHQYPPHTSDQNLSPDQEDLRLQKRLQHLPHPLHQAFSPDQEDIRLRESLLKFLPADAVQNILRQKTLGLHGMNDPQLRQTPGEDPLPRHAMPGAESTPIHTPDRTRLLEPGAASSPGITTNEVSRHGTSLDQPLSATTCQLSVVPTPRLDQQAMSQGASEHYTACQASQTSINDTPAAGTNEQRPFSHAAPSHADVVGHNHPYPDQAVFHPFTNGTGHFRPPAIFGNGAQQGDTGTKPHWRESSGSGAVTEITQAPVPPRCDTTNHTGNDEFLFTYGAAPPPRGHTAVPQSPQQRYEHDESFTSLRQRFDALSNNL